MIKSWKTTLLGLATVLFAVAQFVSSGNLTSEIVAQIVAGIGLILAKDHNVSGGSQ